MRLGIDASNLRTGGGVTHLRELLDAGRPGSFGFESVVIWASSATLAALPQREWLELRPLEVLDRGSARRAIWQSHSLPKLARAERCDVIFVPGGTITNFHPIVTMSRNLLPFEWREFMRFGLSALTAKNLLLRFRQARSFRRADGLIFLSRYAEKVVSSVVGPLEAQTTIIPHGINKRFFVDDRRHRADFSDHAPCRIIYVSTLDPYKHHAAVIKAISDLRRDGLHVELHLVGAKGASSKSVEAKIAQINLEGVCVHHHGQLAYTDLHRAYMSADMKVFASTCENMPNILLEAMAAALPIACSRHGPMPEVLGSAGVYFDPEDPSSIQSSVRGLYESVTLRQRLGERARSAAAAFSWDRCAQDTLEFVAKIARGTGRDR